MPWHIENSGGTDSATVCRAMSSTFLWASQKTRVPFDQVCRSCRRRLRVRIPAVPVLPWYQRKATSPSSLVRHQREGALLPRAVLAGRVFFPTWGTQNHYPRYPRIIQCADTLVMMLLHLSTAFVWHFIIFRHLWVQPCEPDSITVLYRWGTGNSLEVCCWLLLFSLLLPLLFPSSSLSLDHKRMESGFGYRVSDSKSKVLSTGLSF